MRVRAAALLLPLLVSAAPGAQEEKKPRALNVGGVEAAGAGTVAGVVKWKGEKPERKPMTNVLGHAFCKEACGGKAPLEEKWVFGKNGEEDTLRNVLVYVSKGLEGKTFEVPKEPVVLDQVACLYTPHVVGVMAGQTLEVRNSDATLHNVMCTPFNNKPFNDGMPVKGGKIEKVFKNPELRVQLRCFLHPWMLAYVHVLEHPFYAVTQEDGTFTIRGLPPGEYEVSVVHESTALKAEPATAAVKVAAGETRKVEFVYQMAQGK
jgi:plastocyanin